MPTSLLSVHTWVATSLRMYRTRRSFFCSSWTLFRPLLIHNRFVQICIGDAIWCSVVEWFLFWFHIRWIVCEVVIFVCSIGKGVCWILPSHSCRGKICVYRVNNRTIAPLCNTLSSWFCGMIGTYVTSMSSSNISTTDYMYSPALLDMSQSGSLPNIFRALLRKLYMKFGFSVPFSSFVVYK